MTQSQGQGAGRDDELRAIRATYDEYRRAGRDRIWDPQNQGYAAIVRDRNAALVAAVRDALPAQGGRVLDLGCGNGGLADVTRGAGLPIDRWIGVDLDPVSVREAAVEHEWGQFMEGSADDLPFEDGAFEVVVASMLFSSLPTWNFERRVALEITRVLSPTGSLVWYDLRRRNPANRAVHAMTRRRIADLFPEWTAELRAVTLLPPLARRLGPLTGVAYPLLHSVGVLRSHLVGILRRGTEEGLPAR